MVERWRIELQSTACKAIIMNRYTNAPSLFRATPNDRIHYLRYLVENQMLS